MKIPLTISKAVWITAEKMRVQLRPMIEGTFVYRMLQIPSKFIRRSFDWREQSRNSIFLREEEMDMCSLLPSRVLDILIRRYHPRTVLDVGCGTGKSLEYLVRQGIDATGLEGSALAISKAVFPERIIQADLNQPVQLHKRFDVVFSYEVVEHIHPDFLDSLMSTFTSHGDVILISHAQPGQGGEGHFNEQPDDYWIQQFSRFGYNIDWPATQEFKACGDAHAGNMLVFLKASGGSNSSGASPKVSL